LSSLSVQHPIGKCLLLLTTLAFAGLIVWASIVGKLPSEFDAILNFPWGKVAIVDLYLGFVVFAWVIWVTAPNHKTAILFILLLFCLGNLVSLVYLLVISAWKTSPNP
jgi:hypothetical protein